MKQTAVNAPPLQLLNRVSESKKLGILYAIVGLGGGLVAMPHLLDYLFQSPKALELPSRWLLFAFPIACAIASAAIPFGAFEMTRSARRYTLLAISTAATVASSLVLCVILGAICKKAVSLLVDTPDWLADAVAMAVPGVAAVSALLIGRWLRGRFSRCGDTDKGTC
jgi:hypothetical protein